MLHNEAFSTHKTQDKEKSGPSFMDLSDVERFISKTNETSGVTRLMLAARDKDLQSCLELQKHGENARAVTNHGVTLLHFAALNKQHAEEIVSHFVRRQGLQLLAKDADGESPVYYAVRTGHLEVATRLLKLQSAAGENLVHYFVRENRLAVVKAIHEWKGELVRQLDSGGRSALHLAALSADLATCQWLVGQGLDPHAVSADKTSVLHCAVLNKRHGRQLACFFGARRVDANGRTERGKTPLHAALLAENVEMAELLVQLGARLNGNCLFFCVATNKLRSAQWVHSANRKLIRRLDAEGRNALHVAAACADEKMCLWLLRTGAGAENRHSTGLHSVGSNREHGVGITSLFVKLGLDVNKRDRLGCPPIAHALKHCNFSVADKMLSLGADLKAKVGVFNLLHVFIMCNNLESVEYLHGKDDALVKQSTSPHGTNGLHLAATFADESMCHWLCSNGLDVRTLGTYRRNSVLHFAALNRKHGEVLVGFFVNRGVDVNVRNADSETPLHYALEKENFEVARMLLKCGADPNVKIERDNLLVFCIRRKLRRSAKFVLDKFPEQIKNGGSKRQSALHGASQSADLKLCKMLVKNGGNPDLLKSYKQKATKNGKVHQYLFTLADNEQDRSFLENFVASMCDLRKYNYREIQ